MSDRWLFRTLLGLGLLVGLLLGCGDGSKNRPPVNPVRADAGDGGSGDGAGDGLGGSTEPTPGAAAEECARRECNPSVSDLCCPAACSAETDIDCGGCGNGRLEAAELCDPADSCPRSCAQLACEKQRLKSEGTCAAVCVPAGVQSSCMDGDECCPDGCTAANDRDCISQCGNGTTEPGELCDPLTTCPQTCPMQGCTLLKLEGAGTCLARCVEAGQETMCRSDDGCCPAGCTAATDSDCGIVCGNGAIEGKETCDPLASCPKECPAQGCRLRRLVNGDTCTAACIDAGLETMCKSGDGCCPVGCLSTNDDDCPALCGNSVVEAGETCDPIASCLEKERACVSDSATTRTRSGDPGKCQFTCVETARTCGPADGACPPGCGPMQDRDCPGCGNGVTEPSETCDPVASCLERQKACVSDQSTVRAPGGDPNACTFTCSEAPRACGPVDGNCPAGCTADRDGDCAGCGNGVMDPGETCDPVAVCNQRAEACVSDANTVRTPEGDPGTCRFTCRETPRVCGALDGQCPAGCGPTQDRDCPGCGNNRVEAGETCDPCRAEEVRACAGDANTIRTPSGDPASCTFLCTATARPCQNGDGFCPSMCTLANDSECRQGPGGPCKENAECGAGSCVDSRCCVQNCAVCQSCTGAGGTCVPIPAGQPDNVPARACVQPSSCDGMGGCTQPQCRVEIKPGMEDFGPIAVGGSSRAFGFSVTTTCAGMIAATSSSAEFVIVQNSCAQAGAAAGSCTIDVQFRPAGSGARRGTLTVSTPSGSSSADLRGTGQIATLAFKPTAHQFGKVPVGTRTTQGMTLINQGGADTGALTVTTDAPFMVAQNGCPSLPPGKTCEVVVLFFPQKPGEVSAPLVAKAASGVAASAPLQGAGVEQPLQPLTIAPSSHGFGTVLMGSKTAAVPFQVIAGVDLANLKIGSTSSEFVIDSTTCSPSGLSAGKSCVVNLVFAPTVAGQKQATLQATARDAGVFIAAPLQRSAAASLTGTGQPRIIVAPPLSPPVLTR